MNRLTLAKLGVVGAILQLTYGVAAVVDPYPGIVAPGWEFLWLVINLGIIASITAWALTHPEAGRLTRWGAGAAILGHGLRAVISAVLVVDGGAAVDGPIVACILLMYAGMAAVGIDALRQKAGLAPLATLAAGMAAAPFYSFDKHTHFILLGLLWGAAWLWLALTNVRNVERVAVNAG